jgi:hypothetical protein
MPMVDTRLARRVQPSCNARKNDSILDPRADFIQAFSVFRSPAAFMETNLKVPEFSPPSTLAEVLAALRKENLDPRHEAKSWGDWINLECYNTVISIEVTHGLSGSATIEHGDGEEEGEPIDSILRAFGKLGWHGVDDDGEYPLL